MLFWPEISALGVFFNFDNERMHPSKYPSGPPPPPGFYYILGIIFSYGLNGCFMFLFLFVCNIYLFISKQHLHLSLADFKYGVTFNTHGNTNGSVYPSPSTQCEMLTSRPTQMLAMVLHF